MARAPNEQGCETLELSVPAELHAYLVHLARFTPMGANPNDVARRLLTDRVLELQAANYPSKHPY